MKKSRPIIIGVIIGVPTSLIIIFILIFFIWPRIIEKRVHAFCDLVQIDSPSELTIEKAKSLGLQVKEFPPGTMDPNDPQSTVIAGDGVLFDRYHCLLRALNGKIVSKKVAHVD